MAGLLGLKEWLAWLWRNVWFISSEGMAGLLALNQWLAWLWRNGLTAGGILELKGRMFELTENRDRLKEKSQADASRLDELHAERDSLASKFQTHTHTHRAYSISYMSVLQVGFQFAAVNRGKHFHVDHVLFLEFYFGHWESRAIPRDLNSAGWHHISWEKRKQCASPVGVRSSIPTNRCVHRCIETCLG